LLRRLVIDESGAYITRIDGEERQLHRDIEPASEKPFADQMVRWWSAGGADTGRFERANMRNAMLVLVGFGGEQLPVKSADPKDD
jgi:hypothetical protein